MVNNKINNFQEKKGQTLSADILVVIIILLFGVLFLLANNLDKNNVSETNVDKVNKDSTKNSQLIYEELKSQEFLDAENNIDLKKLSAIDINKLKLDLNIKSKFCIVFEKDGKLIQVNPDNNINGIGDSEIIVNDVPCSFN